MQQEKELTGRRRGAVDEFERVGDVEPVIEILVHGSSFVSEQRFEAQLSDDVAGIAPECRHGVGTRTDVVADARPRRVVDRGARLLRPVTPERGIHRALPGAERLTRHSQIGTDRHDRDAPGGFAVCGVDDFAGELLLVMHPVAGFGLDDDVQRLSVVGLEHELRERERRVGVVRRVGRPEVLGLQGPCDRVAPEHGAQPSGEPTFHGGMTQKPEDQGGAGVFGVDWLPHGVELHELRQRSLDDEVCRLRYGIRDEIDSPRSRLPTR